MRDQLWTAEELAEVSEEFETAPPSSVIRWAAENFGESLVLAASFEDIVLVDLATKVVPGIEVIFLDTEAHFPETLSFVEQVRARYDLNLTVTKPGPEAAAHPCGSENCCQFRKVEPLRRAVAGKAAWLTSLKRSDGPTRADAPVVSWDTSFGLVKINPLATWTDADVKTYLADHELPEHPLVSPRLPLHRLRADDPTGGRRRGSPRGTLGRARQIRVWPARLVPRDLDNPYGMEFRGRRDRGLKFIRPYRDIGELNPVEQLKLQRHPFEVAQAVIDTYSKQGAASINAVPGEQERLKWVGMYPQRQGGDAFMMRIKVPGGIMTAAQVREVGVAADAFAEGPDDSPVFGNRYADLTTRQDIQLHWIRIADVPRIWQRFWEVGLTTVQACGDSARNVCSCPVSGIDADEVIDAFPVAQAISAYFTGNREYANLPRKFKIAVTGCTEDCARVEINDIGLWPAERSDGTVGFNVLIGGGLSDGERMASDIDLFVAPDQAVELCRGVAQVFGELGNRENRGLARMRYLAQELGPEGFRAALDERTNFALEPAGRELTTRFRGDHVGVHPQKQDGLVYVGCSVPVGRMHGIELIELARLAETYGDGDVRIGTDQNFVISGVPEDRVDDLLAEELLQTYSPFPGPFERGVVACTGTEFCRFAVVETKERAVKWARALDAQLSEGDQRRGRSHPHALLGLLGLVRAAPDRRHRLPRRHRPRGGAHRGGRRHRARRFPRPRRGVHRLAHRRHAGRPGPRRAACASSSRYRDEHRPGEAFYQWARRSSPDDLRITLRGAVEAVAP